VPRPTLAAFLAPGVPRPTLAAFLDLGICRDRRSRASWDPPAHSGESNPR
jgi:hypothetical protein